ncbi:MAG: hypothetical protein ACXVAT_20225 [Isosphaeraceae bacterium]
MPTSTRISAPRILSTGADVLLRGSGGTALRNGGGVVEHDVGDYSRALLGLPSDAWQAFVTALPGPVGFRLRSNFWRSRLRRMGKTVSIGVGVQFIGADHVELADNCWIDRNGLIVAGPPAPGRYTRTKELPGFPLDPGEVYIGENAHIAPNCVLNGAGGLFVGKNAGIAAHSAIYSYSHHYRFDPDTGTDQGSNSSRAREDQQSLILGPVYIGDYCSLGIGCTILPCTSLGRGTWVACNQVVRGTYEAQTIIRDVARGDVGSLAGLRIRE